MTTRKNRYGGSAGGYDYQAEAYALIAAKILAGENLAWADSGCDRVPVSIHGETGAGGDDLQDFAKQPQDAGVTDLSICSRIKMSRRRFQK